MLRVESSAHLQASPWTREGQELAQRRFCNEIDPDSNGIGSKMKAAPASQERSKGKHSTALNIPKLRKNYAAGCPIALSMVAALFCFAVNSSVLAWAI
jgi:hypothetical protein